MQHIFLNNYQLCSEISEPVLQHCVHLLATHGRHVQYLDFLHTVIKAEGKYVKKCQDMIMTEVRAAWAPGSWGACPRGQGGEPGLLGLVHCGNAPTCAHPKPGEQGLSLDPSLEVCSLEASQSGLRRTGTDSDVTGELLLKCAL